MALWQVDIQFECTSRLPLSEVEAYWGKVFGDAHEIVPGFIMYGEEDGSRLDLFPPKGEREETGVIARIDCRDPNSMEFCGELVSFATQFDLECKLVDDGLGVPVPLDAHLIRRMAMKIFKKRLRKIPGL